MSRAAIPNNGRSTSVSAQSLQKPFSKENTCGTPFTERSYSKADVKVKLSPQSARKLSFSKSSSLSNVSKHEHLASNCSLENTSSSRPKKSFFRSFRTRGRKISSIESGLGNSVSKSSIDKSGKEDGEMEAVRCQLSQAQERRKAFQKAYTTPERKIHSFSRSMDLDSFDYESNQDVYLANYESEMRNSGDGKNLNQYSLTPSKSVQATRSSATKSSSPSLYVTAEQISVPENPSFQANNFACPDQLPRSPVVLQENNNIQHSLEDKTAMTSLSVAPLRPREIDHEEQPTRQLVTPAFATYSGPVIAEKLASSSPTSRKMSNQQSSFINDEENMFEVCWCIQMFL